MLPLFLANKVSALRLAALPQLRPQTLDLPNGSRTPTLALYGPPAAESVAPDLLRIEEMDDHPGDAAQSLKAIGNEERLLILCHLPGQSLFAGDLNARLDLSHATLPQPLALLRDDGLRDARREGHSIYCPAPPGPATRATAVLQGSDCTGRPAPGRRAR